jgi:hypothetical protein
MEEEVLSLVAAGGRKVGPINNVVNLKIELNLILESMLVSILFFSCFLF